MKDERTLANPRICVLGAGAVGGFLAATLSANQGAGGPPVGVIGRRRIADAVRYHGLVLKHAGSSIVTHPEVYDSAADAPRSDIVLLCVRAFDVESAIPDVRRLLKEGGHVIAMQNGVGSEEVLADALGRQRVITGTVTIRTDIESSGIIARRGRGGGLALAPMSRDSVPCWVSRAFARTLLRVKILDDYRSLRWSKLLLNMLGAATSAILDMDIGTIVESPELFRVEQIAFREAATVMARRHVPVVSLPGYPVPVVRDILRLPRQLAQGVLAPRLARARDGQSPMMRSDVARGRSEVRWLNGAVAIAAREQGYAARTNSALAQLVDRLAEEPSLREEYRGRPDLLLAWLRGHGSRV